jgi:HAD superfamily hydrolase (TIGR01549 family)
MVAILFDLEGTLVQSMEGNSRYIKKFKEAISKKLILLGISPDNLKGIQTSALMQNKAFEIVEETFNYKDAQNFHLELDEFLKKYEMNWAVQSKVFPDTVAALRKLRNYKLGIVTNTSRQAAELMLLKHKIKDFFGVVITRNDVKKLKPHPEGIRIAIEYLNQSDFLFVGNSSYDARAAKEAGGRVIIVKRELTKVLKFCPDFVVASLSEIPQLMSEVVPS